MNLLKVIMALIGTNIADKVSQEVKSGLSPVGPYLRKLAIGVVLLLASVFGWILGLLFLIISFFVYLAEQSAYVAPALYTSGACFLVAILLTILGISSLRKPR